MDIPFVLACVTAVSLGAAERVHGEITRPIGEILRLTHSGSDTVLYPSMDRGGKIVAYRQETIDSRGEKKVSIRIVRTEDQSTEVLFTDGTIAAPAPYGDRFLLCGTKPPAISGDGRKVIFSVGLGDPLFVDDHFLAIADSDGSNLRIVAIRNEELARHEWKRWGFLEENWRTISQYRISHDGERIACLVKGHRGARNIPMPSGIVLLTADGAEQTTLMSPILESGKWAWQGYPRRPFTGGGWVFDLSEDGNSLLFGAQSSRDETDYDLYTMDLRQGVTRQLTEIRDPWFIRGDISGDGKTVCFFYSGKKLEGMGTYAIGFGRKGLRLLRSSMTDRLDFEEMTEDGRTILFRVPGKGLAMIEADGEELLILDEREERYRGLKGGVDFPYFPSFWNPRFASGRGDLILLEAVPTGKDLRELFLLRLKAP